jgi:glucuronate isomerase
MKLVFGDTMARDYYESFVKEYEEFLGNKKWVWEIT